MVKQWGQAAIAAAAAAQGASKYYHAFKKHYSTSSNNRRNGSYSGTGAGSARFNGGAGVVTNNVMGAVMSRKKRFNKRKFKKWRRFQRKVLKASEKEQATQNRVYDDSAVINTAVNEQNYCALMLNGYNGDTTNGGNAITDGKDIYNLMDRALATAVAGEQVKITHSYLDCEVTNVAATSTVTTGHPIVLDVYKVVCRSNEGTSSTSTVQNTLAKAYLNGFNQALNPISATGGDEALGVEDIGASPYESFGFVNRWKIINKRRILLNVGASVSLNISDKRMNIVSQDDIATYGVKRGKTLGFLLVWSSCIDAVAAQAGTPVNPANAIAIESVRTYKYKIIQELRKGNVYDFT